MLRRDVSPACFYSLFFLSVFHYTICVLCSLLWLLAGCCELDKHDYISISKDIGCHYIFSAFCYTCVSNTFFRQLGTFHHFGFNDQMLTMTWSWKLCCQIAYITVVLCPFIILTCVQQTNRRLLIPRWQMTQINMKEQRTLRPDCVIKTWREFR